MFYHLNQILAGYKAVIDTAYEFSKALPMMMTAAGTVTPAKYFIIRSWSGGFTGNCNC